MHPPIPLILKTACALILPGLLLSSCQPPVQIPVRPEKLVWEEEFNGSSVNASRWTFETGAGGWGNNELQYYQAQNATLEAIPGESGKRALVITAKEDDEKGYTSSRLITKGKVSWTYGRIEARLKLPEGQGLWPAFWMLGENFDTVSWPACGEIDIMEMVGGAGDRDKTTYATLHWQNADGGHGQTEGTHSKTLAAKLSSGFHVYGVEWTSTRISWSVDGQVFFSQNISKAEFSEFRAPQFLLLNLAVGGNWPGAPDGTAVFPQKYWIDWIRVYQTQ